MTADQLKAVISKLQAQQTVPAQETVEFITEVQRECDKENEAKASVQTDIEDMKAV